MTLKYCLTGILLLSMKVWGQEIKPLSIGDKVPSINLSTIFNYPASRLDLSALKDKIVIFDFMTTNCISCIKALPRFDSIQKTFGDKVQIFLVTPEKREKVIKFLKLHPELKLPIIGEDRLLKKYFPYTFISHEVWIKNGVVKAITEPEYVNSKNIETLLTANTVNWPIKRDLVDFDYSKPLLLNEDVQHYYTSFSGNILNVPPRYIYNRQCK